MLTKNVISLTETSILMLRERTRWIICERVYVVVGERVFAYVCSCVGVSLWCEYVCVCAREREGWRGTRGS